MNIKNNQQLSRQIILDHYSNPVNKGEISHYEHILEIKARGCIDDITIGMNFKDSKVEDCKFNGPACAISTSATDILLSMIKDKTIAQTKVILEEFFKMTSGGYYNEEIMGELNCLSGVKDHPVRIKCAQLPANIITQIIENKDK